MDSKRLSEILTWVKVLITESYVFNTGICEVVSNLYIRGQINETERVEVMNYLHKNVPTTDNDYKEFTKITIWRNPTQSHELWWDSMRYIMEARLTRIAYLIKLIDNIK